MGTSSITSPNPTWITKGERVIVFQAAQKRHPLLAKVPTIAELGVTPEGKAVLNAIAGSSDVGRSILTTPGVPKERLVALRKAFQDMLVDAEFLRVVKERRLMLDPATGEELDRLVDETSKLPEGIVKQIADVVRK